MVGWCLHHSEVYVQQIADSSDALNLGCRRSTEQAESFDLLIDLPASNFRT